MSAIQPRTTPAAWLSCGTLAVCCWLAGIGAANADEGLEKFEFLQIRMGVPVAIQVYAPGQELANQAADAAYARFKQLDRVMSDYDPDSELMRLCRDSGPGKPVRVSDDLFCVLDRAQCLAERTGGAFDVTVGPVVDLWRVARRRKTPPAPDQLEAARRLVGHDFLRLNRDERTVELLRDGMRLDLGGIAVGYALDEALHVIHQHGLTRVLIDASGDILVGDPPPGRAAWRIEVEPLSTDERPPMVLELTNCAVTTSGDAYRFVEFDGVRYSHIVDPKTGYGLTRRSSVTVIARDGITSDSLATAVTVLGPERGLQLIAGTEGAAASIEFADADGIRTVQSPGFDASLAPPPASTNCGFGDRGHGHHRDQAHAGEIHQ